MTKTVLRRIVVRRLAKDPDRDFILNVQAQTRQLAHAIPDRMPTPSLQKTIATLVGVFLKSRGFWSPLHIIRQDPVSLSHARFPRYNEFVNFSRALMDDIYQSHASHHPLSSKEHDRILDSIWHFGGLMSPEYVRYACAFLMAVPDVVKVDPKKAPQHA